MAENMEALLLKKKKRVFYKNCPGCQVDQLNDARKGIPYKEFAYIWIVSLCTGLSLTTSINIYALPISSLFPFAYFMIRDFGIAKREEDIGFYVGYVGSAFMVGRALTSIFWGVVADRYGRKPVILIGTFSVVVFNTLFGFSTSFWMALFARFLLGSFNSLLGPIRVCFPHDSFRCNINLRSCLALLNQELWDLNVLFKAYASEICRQEYRALAQTVSSTSRGIGLVIGPAIGGFFAQETIHMHNGNEIERSDSYDTLDASYCESGEKNDVKEIGNESISKESLFKNRALMSTIAVYCIFSLHEIAYAEVIIS
ncbi:hypothetical protein GIB67_010515 [Kingdonia uniflora]|uniref:Major facilitator superfamily (MFS) profile domain-containing protein n=1 Tax=Kingdonia uniflora TaxID=39325 RepID=A0A7J7MAM3_9MAGN|nr:hypothetical protein GIB67_010515 [Kingdonia uniflora]